MSEFFSHCEWIQSFLGLLERSRLLKYARNKSVRTPGKAVKIAPTVKGNGQSDDFWRFLRQIWTIWKLVRAIGLRLVSRFLDLPLNSFIDPLVFPTYFERLPGLPHTINLVRLLEITRPFQ